MRKIFVQLTVEVSNDQTFNDDAVKMAVVEAVGNALIREQEMGYTHALEGEIQLNIDPSDIRVTDTD